MFNSKRLARQENRIKKLESALLKLTDELQKAEVIHKIGGFAYFEYYDVSVDIGAHDKNIASQRKVEAIAEHLKIGFEEPDPDKLIAKKIRKTKK